MAKKRPKPGFTEAQFVSKRAELLTMGDQPLTDREKAQIRKNVTKLGKRCSCTKEELGVLTSLAGTEVPITHAELCGWWGHLFGKLFPIPSDWASDKQLVKEHEISCYITCLLAS